MNYKTFSSRLPKNKGLTCFKPDNETDFAELLRRISCNGITGYVRQEGGLVLVPDHAAEAIKKHLKTYSS